MHCPRDGEVLQPTTQRGVTLDFCHACGGRWLDHTELEHAVHRSTRVRTTIARLARSRQSLEGPAIFLDTAGDASLSCPRCDVPMQKKRFGSSAAKLIGDRCERCQGMWFDAGEFGAMAVLLEQGLAIRPAVAIAALAALLAAVAATALLVR